MDKSTKALLNEYKGNLYEFLVARELSSLLEIEAGFLRGLDDSFMKMLSIQQNFIRRFDQDLYENLPIYASGLAKSILSKKGIPRKIISVELLGKRAASEKEGFSEADIVLVTSEKNYGISLKLYKSKASVNTKSAGIKSFLSKYFLAIQDQENFSRDFDRYFNEFTYQIHQNHELETDLNFNEWVSLKLPVLPGDLEQEDREAYLFFLKQVRDSLYEKLLAISKKENFLEMLYPLIGFSDPSIIHASCFYRSKEADYSVLFIEQIKSQNFNISKTDTSSSHFCIELDKLKLLIRIKAMNKFISRSFKVNCSFSLDR